MSISFEILRLNLSNDPNVYKALNNTAIEIQGSINSRLCLEQLSNSLFHIDLHVLPDNPLSTDIILGRDFLDKYNLSAIYVSGKSMDENTKKELFPAELLQRIASCYESVMFENVIDEISINFDSSIKSKLKHY